MHMTPALLRRLLQARDGLRRDGGARAGARDAAGGRAVGLAGNGSVPSLHLVHTPSPTWGSLSAWGIALGTHTDGCIGNVC